MADSEIKGWVFRATDRWLRDAYEPAVEQRIRGRLSDETRQLTEKAPRSKWYPANRFNEIIESACQEEPSPAKREEQMRVMGRYLAMDAISTYLRLLLKLFTPGMFLRRLPSFFERDIRPGKVTADLSGLDQRKVILTIVGAGEFLYIGSYSAGWIQHVFEQIGVKDSEVVIDPDGVEVTRSDDIRIEITWN